MCDHAMATAVNGQSDLAKRQPYFGEKISDEITWEPIPSHSHSAAHSLFSKFVLDAMHELVDCWDLYGHLDGLGEHLLEPIKGDFGIILKSLVEHCIDLLLTERCPTQDADHVL
mmetsp:Transcript_42136/g.51163  ORF Transcript_42136/g.51163 Transcript_42136/m.51163 type:complete len:114 (-) Transcript_42136:562-903(-)